MLKDSWFISNRFSQLNQNEKLYTWMYIISILTISLSLVALVCVLTISNSIHESIVEKMASRYPYVEALNLNTPIKAHEKIKGNNVVLKGYTLGSKSKNKAFMTIIAAQIKPEFNLSVIEKNRLFLSKNTIILSKSMSEKLEIKLGDRFLITTQDDSVDVSHVLNSDLKQILVTVIGFMDDHYEFDAITTMQTISNLYIKRWGSVTIVEPKQTKYTEDIVDLLRNEYKVNRNKITVWFDKVPSLFKAIKLEKVAIYTIFSILLIISSFTIFATIASLGIKRKKDVAILRMLGCRRKQIFVIFIMHGIKIFLISSIIGSLFSFLIIYNIDILFSVVDYITGLNIGDVLDFTILKEDDFHINMDFELMASIILLNLVITVFASLIPSYIIAKMETGDVVKYG